MGKKSIRKWTVVRGRAVIFRVMYIEANDSLTVLKVLTDKDPFVHLSLVAKALGIESHITYEPTATQSREHKHWGFMSREKMLRSYLMLFSRPGSYPPRIKSVENKEDMDRVRLWLTKAVPRVIHPSRHRRVKVLKDGDLKRMISRLLNSKCLLDAEFNMEELMDKADDYDEEADVFELKYEDEIRPEGLELGLLEHPDRVVILSPIKAVMELRLDSINRWQRSLAKMPGIDELFAELEERGIVPKKRTTLPNT